MGSSARRLVVDANQSALPVVLHGFAVVIFTFFFWRVVRNRRPYSITMFLNRRAYSRAAMSGWIASSLTSVYSVAMNCSSFSVMTFLFRRNVVAAPHLSGAISPGWTIKPAP